MINTALFLALLAAVVATVLYTALPFIQDLPTTHEIFQPQTTTQGTAP